MGRQKLGTDRSDFASDGCRQHQANGVSTSGGWAACCRNGHTTTDHAVIPLEKRNRSHKRLLLPKTDSAQRKKDTEQLRKYSVNP